MRDLPVNEQRQTVFESQIEDLGLIELLGQSLGHADQLEALEWVDGGVIEHAFSLGSVVVAGAADIAVRR